MSMHVAECTNLVTFCCDISCLNLHFDSCASLVPLFLGYSVAYLLRRLSFSFHFHWLQDLSFDNASHPPHTCTVQSCVWSFFPPLPSKQPLPETNFDNVFNQQTVTSASWATRAAPACLSARPAPTTAAATPLPSPTTLAPTSGPPTLVSRVSANSQKLAFLCYFGRATFWLADGQRYRCRGFRSLQKWKFVFAMGFSRGIRLTKASVARSLDLFCELPYTSSLFYFAYLVIHRVFLCAVDYIHAYAR